MEYGGEVFGKKSRKAFWEAIDGCNFWNNL